MNEDEPEIFALLRQIRYDTTAIQAKITDALTMLGRMNLPAKPRHKRGPKQTHCPACGAESKQIREHLARECVGDRDLPATVISACETWAQNTGMSSSEERLR